MSVFARKNVLKGGSHEEVEQLKNEIKQLGEYINATKVDEEDETNYKIKNISELLAKDNYLIGGANKSAKKSSKKASKKASKKSSKKSSKKASKKSLKGGKVDPLAKYREWVAFVQSDFKLKGGPLTNTFAAYFRNKAKAKKPNGSQDELNNLAKEIYNSEKKAGNLDKLYKQVEASFKEKKEKKRAEKKAKKASMKAMN